MATNVFPGMASGWYETSTASSSQPIMPPTIYVSAPLNWAPSPSIVETIAAAFQTIEEDASLKKRARNRKMHAVPAGV